jgi:hypothetical protein
MSSGHLSLTESTYGAPPYSWMLSKQRITISGGAYVAKHQIVFILLHQLAASYSELTFELVKKKFLGYW